MRRDADFAVMAPDDSTRGIQSQPCSLSHPLGGKEGVKDVGQNIGRNPRPAVSNFHQHAVKLQCGPNPQLTLPLHGLDGIGDQVRPNLIQLAAVGADLRKIFSRIRGPP